MHKRNKLDVGQKQEWDYNIMLQYGSHVLGIIPYDSNRGCKVDWVRWISGYVGKYIIFKQHKEVPLTIVLI